MTELERKSQSQLKKYLKLIETLKNDVESLEILEGLFIVLDYTPSISRENHPNIALVYNELREVIRITRQLEKRNNSPYHINNIKL